MLGAPFHAFCQFLRANIFHIIRNQVQHALETYKKGLPKEDTKEKDMKGKDTKEKNMKRKDKKGKGRALTKEELRERKKQVQKEKAEKAKKKNALHLYPSL